MGTIQAGFILPEVGYSRVSRTFFLLLLPLRALDVERDLRGCGGGGGDSDGGALGDR